MVVCSSILEWIFPRNFLCLFYFLTYTEELLVDHLLIYHFLLKRNRIIDHYLIPRKSEIKLFSIITTEKRLQAPYYISPN
jgi:hypothetical protein